MTKVLIAEDSPTIRNLLQKILSSSPDIEVIDTASNGKEAVEKTIRLRPDLVTMDIRMPIMNGFEATREIMRRAPTPILVISASVNSDDLKITFNAIQAGALDIIEKPRGGLRQNYEEMAAKIIRKVKVISGVKVFHHFSKKTVEKRQNENGTKYTSPAVRNGLQQRSGDIPEIVCIAASTGGPGALSTVLKDLPADFPVPIVVVQHITNGFGEGFVSWLNNICKMSVKSVKAGIGIEPGTIYVAPDDYHLLVGPDKKFRLNKSLPVSGLRPYATYLLNSLAEYFGDRTMGIILTGMGRDGSDGIKSIKLAGGVTVAQNEESCIVFGMPKEAIAMGVVDYVLDLEDIHTLLKNTFKK